MARHTAKSHKIRKVEILVIQMLICIKSICDFADANKGDSAQKYAAFTSTLFAKKLIEEDLEF